MKKTLKEGRHCILLVDTARYASLLLYSVTSMLDGLFITMDLNRD